MEKINFLDILLSCIQLIVRKYFLLYVLLLTLVQLLYGINANLQHFAINLEITFAYTIHVCYILTIRSLNSESYVLCIIHTRGALPRDLSPAKNGVKHAAQNRRCNYPVVYLQWEILGAAAQTCKDRRCTAVHAVLISSPDWLPNVRSLQ